MQQCTSLFINPFFNATLKPVLKVSSFEQYEVEVYPGGSEIDDGEQGD